MEGSSLEVNSWELVTAHCPVKTGDRQCIETAPGMNNLIILKTKKVALKL